jgi:uncharacterized membrane protein
MGRLQIELRHGHDGPGQWGPAAVLLALIALAVAGGAHGKALSAVVHDVLVGVEITAAVLGAVVALVLAVVITRFAARVRRAMRAAAERRAAAVTALRASHDATLGGVSGRPALDAARRRFGDITPPRSGTAGARFGDIIPPADDWRA